MVKLHNSALEMVRDAAKGRMLPVLDLDPVRRSAAAVDALAMLGDQTLKPHPARSLEQLGTDLTLLEGRHENPLDPAELGRVFPLLAVPGAPPPPPQTEHDAMADVLVAELRATIADLRRDCDHWRDAHERGQVALAEAQAAHTATQRLLLPPASTAGRTGRDADRTGRDADRTGRNAGGSTETPLVEAGR